MPKYIAPWWIQVLNLQTCKDIFFAMGPLSITGTPINFKAWIRPCYTVAMSLKHWY